MFGRRWSALRGLLLHETVGRRGLLPFSFVQLAVNDNPALRDRHSSSPFGDPCSVCLLLSCSEGPRGREDKADEWQDEAGAPQVPHQSWNKTGATSFR